MCRVYDAVSTRGATLVLETLDDRRGLAFRRRETNSASIVNVLQ